MAHDGRPRQMPIAVVGLAAFMPGSIDLTGFWRNVLTGRDLMTDVPPSRWLVGDYYDPDQRATDKTYGKRGAFLPPVDFDPVRYGIPPSSLPAIDTTQLLALMVADRVIADCAVALPDDRERVSVLLGVAPLQMIVEAASRLDRPVWRKALLEHGIAAAEAEVICDAIAGHFVPWQEETFPGLLSNVVSGRIANKFDLHGVNHTTDAACASSLAALYSAVADLSLRRSDLVITGGVDTANDILMYKCFSSTPALSPTGDCRPFSAAADGTMLGEGVVMFALKRLADAERDGDRVHAVIRGVGASSDGRGTAIYAPLPAGQVRALRRAYEQAGYGPETVELVEAHGTGTTAGDGAEFTALREVFDATGRADRQWCALGSVKSQVGHTKAAAGAAGMLKAVLALRQKVLPPTIKVDAPNPALELAASPFYIATVPRPWIRPADAYPRRASVSSFGFGGTNFHVAMEEYVPPEASAAVPAGHLRAAPTELILLSASSPGALLERARQLDLGRPLPALADHVAADFDPQHAARLAIVAADPDDLAAKITIAAERIEGGQRSPSLVHYESGRPAPGLTAFLFPGQGAQYIGMGDDLAMHLPLARAAWDAAARHELGDRPLHRVVFPPPAFGDEERQAQQALLTATEWAQPALAVQSMALLAVLTRLGLRPDCVAGHSFGELIALHAAGAFDAGTLLQLARRRGELMRDAAAVPGGMLAVMAGRDRAEAAIAGLTDIWLANDNGPGQVAFSGRRQALDAAEARFAANGIACVRLQAATGFHSPLVASSAGPFAKFLEQAEIRAPALDVYAGSDAKTYPADPAAVRHGLAEQIAAPVRFAEVIETMYDQGVRTFVEVGAGSTLSALVGQILGEREHAAVSLDHKGRHGITSLQNGLGHLAVRGLALDLAVLHAPDDEQQRAEKPSKASVRIDGGNYARPYPPAVTAPAAVPVPVPAAAPAPAAAPVRPRPPAVAPPAPVVPLVQQAGNGAGARGTAASDEWLRVLGAAQEQAAVAHADFQRALTESHMAYLQMAEATFGQLMAAATSEAPPATQIPARPASMPAPPLAGHQELPKLPVPVPAPPAETSATPSRRDDDWDVESVSALLLELVADRTGYPIDMLSVDMEIDTDLGIDSIKKVEILSAVRERIGDAPGNLAELATLRTLRAIAEHYARAVGPSPVAQDTPVSHWKVSAVPAPASGLAMPGLMAGKLAVTDDETGVAPELVARLAGHGIRAEVVTDPPADACGLIALDGLRPVATAREAESAQRRLFQVTRQLAARMNVFVTVQDTGGDFGLSGYGSGTDPARAWLGGPAALARTAAKEWPRAAVKAIDCATAGRSAAEIASTLVTELLTGGATLDAGLRADGTRITLQLDSAPTGEGARGIRAESVIVATGGARGVTAASMRLLASKHQPRLALLGRTPLDAEPPGLSAATTRQQLIRLLGSREQGTPAEIAATADRVLAGREVRDTLDVIKQSGAPVRYYAVDVTDLDALGRVLAEVRADWGPITGIVHGAGVLADALITDKTDEQFDRVFAAKVTGLNALLAATADDPLEIVCAFSSVAALFGNPGQCDYAMANEVLNQVLSAERARRPGCLVRAIGWGPWHGGMVTDEIAGRFRDAGVALIDPDAGAAAFLAELSDPAGPSRVIVSAGDTATGPEVVAGQVMVAGPDYAYLLDHQVGDVPVAAVATVLDWFVGAARAWRPKASSLAINDLRVLSKLVLPHLADDGHLLTVNGQQAGEALDVDLCGDSGQRHYRASAITALPSSAIAWDTPAGLVPLPDPYDSDTLFHGPRLRVIRSVPEVGPAGAAGVVAGSRALGWERRSWNLDPAAVDGALQLAVLWARHAGAGRTLPMAIRECRVHRPGTAADEFRCVVLARRVTDSAAICDAALIAAGGAPWLELLGVELVRRPDGD
jgi:acyl transferase domain-containing protein/NADP-dependent 3-hydroxy acid dehydrogenase YdfG